MTSRTIDGSAQAAREPLVPAGGSRFDALWVALPLVALAYLVLLTTQSFGAQTSATLFTVLPLLGLLVFSLFGGMLLGLGVLWVNALRLGERRGVAGSFGAALGGGALATGLALLLLPRETQYPLNEIGPWIYLSATLLLLLMALLKEGAVDAPACAAWALGRSARPRAEVARDFVSMMKPSLNGLVLVTAFVGYIMASTGAIAWGRCLWLMIGTALVAGGASVLNQVSERGPDALMARTAKRPLPSGRLAPEHALTFGIACAVGGMLLLATLVSLGAAALAALTLGTYVFLYTPLKRINSLSTLAGAISGALPPLLGWIAAGEGIGNGGLLLFFILFFWQIPHFLAISWKYRAEYGRAGFPMYSVQDESGRATAWQSLLYGGALLVVSVLIWRMHLAGWVYLGVAVALGLGMLAMTVQFLRRPTPATARNLFFATLLYLPVMLAFMVLNRIPIV